MNLDDIPADVMVEMTPDLRRAFLAANCNPTCHVCQKKIRDEQNFQLISFLGVDQMVCGKCGRKELEAWHAEKLKTHTWLPLTAEGYGGYYVLTRRGGYLRRSRHSNTVP